MWLFVMVWYIEQIPEFILTFIYICSFESEPMILFFIVFQKKFLRFWARCHLCISSGSCDTLETGAEPENP